jgi:hypothetical protein
MPMLCLGPSESEKIISTAFRLTPYSPLIEVVTSARSTRGKPATDGPRFPSVGSARWNCTFSWTRKRRHGFIWTAIMDVVRLG